MAVFRNTCSGRMWFASLEITPVVPTGNGYESINRKKQWKKKDILHR